MPAPQPVARPAIRDSSLSESRDTVLSKLREFRDQLKSSGFTGSSVREKLIAEAKHHIRKLATGSPTDEKVNDQAEVLVNEVLGVKSASAKSATTESVAEGAGTVLLVSSPSLSYAASAMPAINPLAAAMQPIGYIVPLPPALATSCSTTIEHSRPRSRQSLGEMGRVWPRW